MKKVLILVICALAVTAIAQRYSMLIDAEGNIIGKDLIVEKNKLVVVASTESAVDGYVPIYTEEGLTTSGVSFSNFVWQAGYTNVSQIMSSVGKPYGIASLNKDGKIDASHIESITVVFAGVEAIDVE